MSNLIVKVLENMEKMGKFLKICELPKFNQEDIKLLNRPKSGDEIEAVIKTLPRKKCPEPNGFTAEFSQNFREAIKLQDDIRH